MSSQLKPVKFGLTSVITTSTRKERLAIVDRYGDKNCTELDSDQH